jgi:O-antigen/teichoic acid export membrane protein
MVMTFGELLTNIAQFQSWKAVVGFGSAHRKSGSKDRLARLVGYTAVLDWLSGGAVALIGVLCIPLVAPLFHWTNWEAAAAAWFAAALLLTSGTTAVGVLRVSNRFDLQVGSEVVAQLTRLFGCVAGWALGGGVAWFLVVWAMAAILLLLTQWAAVLWLGHRPSIGRRNLRLALDENLRLWPFMLKTNLSGSLSLFWMHLGTLAVGAGAGVAQAGAFRLADRFSQAMLKPVEIAAKALMPELAQLVAERDFTTLRALLGRVTLMSALFAIPAVAVAGLWGGQILRLTVGAQFEYAHQFLFLMCISAAISVTGFALEPLHNAWLRAGSVLRAYLVSALIYLALLAVMLPRFGAVGAALASIVSSAAITGLLGVSALRLLRRGGYRG